MSGQQGLGDPAKEALSGRETRLGVSRWASQPYVHWNPREPLLRSRDSESLAVVFPWKPPWRVMCRRVRDDDPGDSHLAGVLESGAAWGHRALAMGV